MRKISVLVFIRSSANAREALVNSIKDQLLDFVLQVLPKVEVTDA